VEPARYIGRSTARDSVVMAEILEVVSTRKGHFLLESGYRIDLRLPVETPLRRSPRYSTPPGVVS